MRICFALILTVVFASQASAGTLMQWLNHCEHQDLIIANHKPRLNALLLKSLANPPPPASEIEADRRAYEAEVLEVEEQVFLWSKTVCFHQAIEAQVGGFTDLMYIDRDPSLHAILNELALYRGVKGAEGNLTRSDCTTLTPEKRARCDLGYAREDMSREAILRAMDDFLIDVAATRSGSMADVALKGLRRIQDRISAMTEQIRRHYSGRFEPPM